MMFHIFLEIFFKSCSVIFRDEAQYLVRLDSDTCCSAHWKWGFICDEDSECESFCVTGAVFGEVWWWHQLLRAMRFHMWWGLRLWVFWCDRRSIWWGLMVTPVAPCIVNEVSYVMRTQNVSLFVWQAQYLVSFDGDTCCSAHWKWGFICDEDSECESFCLTGAICGEVWWWH